MPDFKAKKVISGTPEEMADTRAFLDDAIEEFDRLCKDDSPRAFKLVGTMTKDLLWYTETT